MRSSILLLLFFFMTGVLICDQPRRVYRFSSPNGIYSIKLTNEEQGLWTVFENSKKYKKPIPRYSIVDPLKAYKLSGDSTLKPDIIMEYMGQLETMSIFLSNDGKRIVVVNDWPEDLDKGHLLLMFYDRGRMLKSYKLQDLVEDKSNLWESASHYGWLSDYNCNIESDVLTIVTSIHFTSKKSADSGGQV